MCAPPHLSLYYFDVIANLLFCYIISAAIDFFFSCLYVTDFVDITTQLEFDFKIQIQSVAEEEDDLLSYIFQFCSTFYWATDHFHWAQL